MRRVMLSRCRCDELGVRNEAEFAASRMTIDGYIL